jgi:hypothetical protein
MDLAIQFTLIAVLIPVVAGIMLWATSGDISERHHSHHDTYVMASTLSWSLVFSMVFMGALGILLEWLCMVGVFRANGVVVLGFFDAFLIVAFVYWLLLRRYKVVTYDDEMVVTPFLGKTVVIRYKDISAMEWTTSIITPKSRNVRVFVGHQRRALLWSVLDLNQILVRINRFDVLDNLSS